MHCTPQDFEAISDLFSEPLKETAFQKIAAGIALYPVEAQASEVVAVTEQDMLNDEFSAERNPK